MNVVTEINKDPKTVKCGESADYLALKVIESAPVAYDHWQPDTAQHKAFNDVDRYVDQIKDEVNKAAKEWVDSVQCKGKSETCKNAKCRKDIKLRTGEAHVVITYSGNMDKRGYVVCRATITSEMQTVHCNCTE